MKKINSIISILVILMISNSLIANTDTFSDAIKFVKLSNTYREAKDYENALKFLKRSEFVIKNNKNIAESRYWSAAIDESYYYIYRDLGLLEEASTALNNAIQGFSKIISQKDGSPLPLELIKDNLKNLDYQKQLISPSLKNNIKIINLDNQKLKSLPSDIPSNVENISLAGNRFKEFPTNIYSYESIKYLNLSDNKLRNIRADFSQIKSLVWLNLSKNKIRTIDANFQELKKLQFLDISENGLTNIPKGIAELKSLKILNLKNNKIPFEQISNVIRALPNTNILYDVYILKGEEEEGIEE